MVQVNAEVEVEIDDYELGEAAWDAYIFEKVDQMFMEERIDCAERDGPSVLEDVSKRLERIEDALDAFIKALRPGALSAKPLTEVLAGDDDDRVRVTLTATTKETTDV